MPGSLSFLLTAAVAASSPTVPVEPIGAIVEAARTHQLVAIGEEHGCDQLHAFLRALVRDRRFADAFNDIVVEFGNAKYQDVIDRFVRGNDVPYEVLREVWQNTTQPTHIWDLPVYEEFFRTVRAVNASRSDRRLRVVLGDSPIDWDQVHSRDDVRKFANRDRWAADTIEREVLAKHRRALVIYGGTHLLRPGGSLVGLLESEGAERIYTIWTHVSGALATLQSDAASWRAPSVVPLRGTALGGTPFGCLPGGVPLN